MIIDNPVGPPGRVRGHGEGRLAGLAERSEGGESLACQLEDPSFGGAMRALILLLPWGATVLPPASPQVAPTPLEAFRALVSPDGLRVAAGEELVLEGWEDAHASILVELIRLAEGIETRRRILSILERAAPRRRRSAGGR